MPSKRLAVFVASFSVILGSLATTTPLLAASKEKVLYSFCSAGNCTDGASPAAGLAFDKAGNLYGTTYNGGADYAYEGCCGTVFKLIPENGTWTEKVLHTFSQDGNGNYPESTLIWDASGNLYGTTYFSGPIASPGPGVVFELKHGATGWTEHQLSNGDGNPAAGLIRDKPGNLYGATQTGGARESGDVFELIYSNGRWTRKVLYTFCPAGKCNDGDWPEAGLIFDAAGNAYGTTYYGGVYGYGTVFELIRGNGTWTEKVLHSFNHDGEDGVNPFSRVIFDAAGNLYGTTQQGGTGNGPYCLDGCGVVFELSPGPKGTWSRKILHNFNENAGDGADPDAGLIFDKAGSLYGTTGRGGTYGYGTVFKLVSNNGKWTESILHSFGGAPDGALPLGDLILDKAGNLYGTTAAGGANSRCGLGCGTVFEITP
jgi:uncharacterized repeat protein (TIGR03803 family)